MAQLVRVSACHAEGRGFESRLPRHLYVGKLDSQNESSFLACTETPKGVRVKTGKALKSKSERWPNCFLKGMKGGDW